MQLSKIRLKYSFFWNNVPPAFCKLKSGTISWSPDVSYWCMAYNKKVAQKQIYVGVITSNSGSQLFEEVEQEVAKNFKKIRL